MCGFFALYHRPDTQLVWLFTCFISVFITALTPFYLDRLLFSAGAGHVRAGSIGFMGDCVIFFMVFFRNSISCKKFVKKPVLKSE